MKKLVNLHLVCALLSIVSLLAACSSSDDNTTTFNLSLAPANVNVKVGEYAELTLTGLPAGATVVWKSENAGVATVSNGTVTGVAKGTTVISADAKIGNATGHAKCTVVVTERQKTDAIAFKDPNLRTLILAQKQKIDANGDGEISYAEAEQLTELDLSVEDKASAPANKVVKRLDGIEAFVNLQRLDLKNQSVFNASLISNLTKLTYLNLGGNGIKTVDVSKMSALTDLRLYRNPDLTSIDLSHNPVLSELYLQDTGLTKLDLTGMNNLTKVLANRCALNDVKLSNLPKLEHIELVKNKLASLTAENLPALVQLHANNNELATVTLNNLPELNRLNLYGNHLTTFSADLPKLMFLFLFENQLTSLDLSKLPMLFHCNLTANPLTTLDFSKNTIIRDIYATNMTALVSIDLKNGAFNDEAEYDIIEGNTKLTTIKVDSGDEETMVKRIASKNTAISVVTN